jgi:hypothetical protein
VSKLILKPTVQLNRDSIDRIEAIIANNLEKNGFAVIDPIFEVYEIKEKEVE